MGQFLSKYTLGISAMLALIIGGCAPEEVCITDNTTVIQVGFFKEVFSGTDSAEVEEDTLIINSITALGTDSVFLSAQEVSQLTLPINTGSDQSTYNLELPSSTETLQFSYQVFSRFVSEDCGLELIVDSLKLGQTSFDSVVITQTLLNSNIDNNVEVYR